MCGVPAALSWVLGPVSGLVLLPGAAGGQGENGAGGAGECRITSGGVQARSGPNKQPE